MQANPKHYYTATGFSAYYLSNIVFNVVNSTFSFMRHIEEILGDVKTEWYAKPFKKFSNLHDFIENITISILSESAVALPKDSEFIRKLLGIHSVPYMPEDIADQFAFDDFASQSREFGRMVESLTEEVFHILFNDVGLMYSFNILCASYIEIICDDHPLFTKRGRLRRVPIPAWARKAIFYRDKGECRTCKRDLSGLITQLNVAHFDHIVPLNQFGANDVTNLQLLCEGCNKQKSGNHAPVSVLYQKAIR